MYFLEILHVCTKPYTVCNSHYQKKANVHVHKQVHAHDSVMILTQLSVSELFTLEL